MITALLVGSGCPGPAASPARARWDWERAAAREEPRAEGTDIARRERVAALLRGLSAADCQLRMDSAHALQQHAGAVRAAIPALIAYVKHSTCDIDPAVAALGSARSALADHMPALIDCMESDVSEGSWACADLLAGLGARALPHLEQLVAGPPSPRRNLAIHALGRMGAPAVPRLIALAHQACDAAPASASGEKDSDLQRFRYQVVDALGAAGGPALQRVRELWRTDRQRRTRECVVWLLSEMAAAHSAADAVAQDLLAELLRAAAQEGEPPQRRKAQAALRLLEAEGSATPPP